jgi:3-oxoacyl-[acyl-carrier-protein] synthase-3
VSATQQPAAAPQDHERGPERPQAQRAAVLAAVAMAVPERLVANEELARLLGVEPEWIAKRTGTHERPWARPGERLSDFAARAGRAALERAGVAPEHIDLVLVATSTADEITPNAGPLVAGLIGADRAGALDVGAACTGWLSALSLACGQIESGRARHAVVVGADFLSRFLDASDRDTAPLFADGAGAAVLTATESAEGRVGPVVLRADHAGSHLIRLARGEHIQMDGRETFRVGVHAMAEVTTEALAAGGCHLDDVDLFVYHQANSRIIRAVGQRLDLPPERVVDYVDRFANASTATLPIALTVAQAEGRIRPHDRVLLAAFGGGLTWGATVVQWSARASTPTRSEPAVA